jgi:hypothetical protein
MLNTILSLAFAAMVLAPCVALLTAKLDDAGQRTLLR